MSEAVPLTVGRVVKPHGIRGELVVDPRTDSPELRFAVGAVLRVSSARRQSITVAAARPHAGRLLVRAEGVDSRDAAEELRGAWLQVSPEEASESTGDPDEFHDHQLEGLRAQRPDGREIGVVSQVVHTPGGELLAVDTERESGVLVPFVAAIVPEVDLPGGRVVLDPPEGLFDES